MYTNCSRSQIHEEIRIRKVKIHPFIKDPLPSPTISLKRQIPLVKGIQIISIEDKDVTTTKQIAQTIKHKAIQLDIVAII